ncbi:DUF4175 domain-containing protein [Natronosalvus amylolyticus]|uniref:DUF4175 domain-containing protein n=1 Tax=Natronosalvus amylolyticus TaxID=2961994 RepID=UPI0020C98CFB|nr:DUF4175 domain-containing protein [Natronosalvus amylolyticus]
MDDGDRLDDQPLSAVIDEPADIPTLRERIKTMAQEARDRGEEATVEDFLAQSRKNDAAYISPADLEKAEWVADIYEQEGEPETHARDFHYRILGKGYEMRDGSEYAHSNRCWIELKEAFKWARILGLIDSSRIEDSTNTDVTPTAFESVDRPLPNTGETDLHDIASDIDVDDGYRHARLPSRIEPAEILFEDTGTFIETAAKMVADQAFHRMYFDANAEQRYYIEIWSEKSGVIPEALAGEYGATIREAGKGEFSLTMCEKAIDIAATRNQDLAVVIVSDWDSKGADMPLSAGRKLEVLGALNDVDVELVKGAVTKAQVKEYGIPGDPAKVPDGLERGVAAAKGYETQKQLFREYAGQYPVEIQGFSTRYPEAFEKELEERLEAFYDAELGERIKERMSDARDDAREALQRAFYAREDEIETALEELRQAVDRYQDRLEGDIEAAQQGLSMLEDREYAVREDERITKYRSQLTETISGVDHREVLAAVDVPLPKPDSPGVDEPLLDTRRTFLEQLEAYRQYNMRYDE